MTLRTITLPTNSGAIWTNFGWESRALADNLPYGIDAKAWLAASNPPLAIIIATVRRSPDLVVSAPRYSADRTQVLVDISGGVAGVTSWARFTLYLSDGSDVNVEISIATRPDAVDPTTLSPVADPLLAAALTVGGAPLTIGGALITL